MPEYNSDDSEGEDQQPVIVVVNPGDLSAEEVAEAKRGNTNKVISLLLFSFVYEFSSYSIS